MSRHVDVLEPRRLMAITLPAGFTQADFVTGLSDPTALAFAPDGRLFVTEQGGALRVVKGGVLLPTPFVSLPVDSDGERGLLGVAFDPDFEANRFVYVYYTATEPTVHNRVSRFTATGDVAEPASETVLLDLPTLGPTNHNGGALLFGADRMLYIAVGDNSDGGAPPSLESPLGKVLRISPDGAIPESNPFFTQTTGINRAIWAKGLRNPYTMAVQPGTGRIYINDVGQNEWEEVNEGRAGADFGWPATEGPTSAAGVTGPVYAYRHPEGFAVIGGAFMPDGRYYFGDFTGGFLRQLNPANGQVRPFATGVPTISGMTRGPDDAIYLLRRSGNAGVVRVGGNFAAPANTAPTAVLRGPAAGTRYVAGTTLRFGFAARDREDRRFGATAFSHTVQRLTNGGATVETLASASGQTALAFRVPNDTAGLGTDVTYRVTLNVTDSGGLTSTVTRDYLPRISTVTVRPALPRGVTQPAAIAFTLNGVALTLTGPATGVSFQAVAGVRQVLVAPEGVTAVLTSRANPTGSERALAFQRWTGVGFSRTATLDFAAPVRSGVVFARYALI